MLKLSYRIIKKNVCVKERESTLGPVATKGMIRKTVTVGVGSGEHESLQPVLELCSIKLQYGTYPTLVEEETFSHLIRLVPLIYSNGPSNGLSKLGLGCGVGLV